ncbi:MAG: pyruvate:ferredoxin (flavodoxin) oxidoreductase [Eubacterium sp.]|nr:pyruvate:ferredoxin (flavodoxin) oxidoreductase [Eubacterium sp.]MCM1304723.1 pyruvate:ferredoxin (flavodoxin) oxidoreductase [Butyrivibrio sp.]MCM1344925.1 pyruvate:ferredoxin (flavodoxin) oxidoreductase [Muribaculaceae bacterium]MCM1412081.1 pyruvate:ferredoxin (flavodoxin) oxidoreductase [Lachnospiraceae bacterium]
MSNHLNQDRSNDPRALRTIDGNHAAAHVAYAYSEVAAIYPITPSSPMAELCDQWAGAGQANIWGQPMTIAQMQSEAGAASAVHGALLSGALATTFTSSQGLLLMLPALYRMAGELLPGVIHVAARSIATHALSIFGDHSDIFACRQTGCAIFACGSVQETMDLSPVSHLAAIEGRVPFLNFFDGFRTSHELHKVRVWDYGTLKSMLSMESVARFRENCLHPHHGKVYGSAQNPDIFFQAREASNPVYLALPGIVEKQLAKINRAIGTDYGLFNYYGNPCATHVIIAMGSVCETIREYLETVPDQPYGLIAVHLYRPFSAKHLKAALPASVELITVLSRTKEPGAPGEPLFLDVAAALQGMPYRILSGRYGLSSKDTTPAQIAAVYLNTIHSDFTVGIEDDVTHLSLSVPPIANTAPPDLTACKFWGLGGDGTVSATKNIIKIIGDNTELSAQGYFEYDSKKSRGLTISHLRFGKSPIHSAYLVQHADLVACHNPVYLHKYDMVQDLKEGGAFLLNCHFREEELEEYLPDPVKAYLAKHHIRFYIIDAIRIGKEIGLNNKISTILQAAFFAVSGLLPPEDAKQLMKEAAAKSYGKAGGDIQRMNEEAIDRGFQEVYEAALPEEWGRLAEEDVSPRENGSSIDSLRKNPLDNPPLPDRPETLSYVENIQQPVTDQRGNELPVSAFLPYADGFTPPGTTAHERRNVATEIPVWKPENCIQCNRCSFVCPHAVIRPAVLKKGSSQPIPEGMQTLPMAGMEDHIFSVVISDTDCTGCGTCAAICPGKQGNKALEMVPIAEHEERQQYFDFGKPLLPCREAAERFRPDTVKGSQFLRPYLEFSGACAGCGETPYVKLLTQLFGDRMFLANATGCSSIWANSAPSCAYTVDDEEKGPAWSNSLFEDAAEFGYGMLLAQEAAAKRGDDRNTIQWVIGGDGWAYDIGFSGLDHVLASGRNINLLVLDTEVYSNTGGQASKATPLGSTAKFASGGKTTRKKDLASMAMTYGNVYVAQIAMGADFNQTLKAFTEAAAYPGPSLVIAYATCIAHGIRSGLGSTPHEAKKAVDSGYFHLFRFNPLLKEEGKNPFTLDSGEPKLDYEEFLDGEIRYDVLKRQKPEQAERLFAQAEKQAKERYEYFKRLTALYAP